jgi:hypothetical protein
MTGIASERSAGPPSTPRRLATTVVQTSPFVREAGRESHQIGDECVGLLNCLLGAIDEACLDLLPASAQLLALLLWQERCLCLSHFVFLSRDALFVRSLDEFVEERRGSS